MKKIELTKGAFALVDDCDYEELNVTKWYLTSHGYATKYTKGNRYIYMHRVIAKPTGKKVVDHIDGNKLNNTRENLRLVDPIQNCWNRHVVQGQIPLIGVHDSSNWHKKMGWKLKKPYSASITKNGKSIWLGRFATPEEAGEAYQKAKASIHTYF